MPEKKNDPFFTCTLRVGCQDKANIQKTARESGMTFQRFAVESVFRRIYKKPPVKKIIRQQKQRYVYDTVITCRFNEWQKSVIKKAAESEQLSVADYVLGAVFGDYQYSTVPSVQKRTEQLLNNSTMPESRLCHQNNPPSKTLVQLSQQSSDDPNESTFFGLNEHEQTLLWYIPIGYKDKAQIRNFLRQKGVSFQQLATERVFQRLVGKPPAERMERLERILHKDHYSVIKCSFTKQQRKKIHKAALVAGSSVPEYILDAIFGDYLPVCDTASKTNRNKKDACFYYLRIGISEKERIQRAANLADRNIGRYILRAVKYRLKGLSPIQIIPFSLFRESVTKIEIPSQIVESKMVRRAAKRENLALGDYIRGAIFGNYKPRFHTPSKQS